MQKHLKPHYGTRLPFKNQQKFKQHEHQNIVASRTPNTATNQTPRQPCSGCGSFSHGAPGANDRPSQCPAWEKQCLHCKKANHYASVCRNKRDRYKLNNESAEAIIDQEDTTETLVGHVAYNKLSDTYITPADRNTNEIPATLTTPWYKA